MIFEGQALLYTTSCFPQPVTLALLVAFINNTSLYTLEHYHHLHLTFTNSVRYTLKNYH